jgi:hypothetical protein
MNKVDYANNVFVKKGKFGTKVSIKVDAFIEELKAKKNKTGYVNLEIKETKSGDKLYAVYDNWEPTGDSRESLSKKPQAVHNPVQKSVQSNDDLPF